MKLASLKKLFLFGARQERLHKCFCWLTVFNVEDRDVDKYDLFYWFKSGLVCKGKKSSNNVRRDSTKVFKEKRLIQRSSTKLALAG
jgi:hypothetical protein